MPDGVLQWFDPETGEGRVLHRRRRYAVGTADVEAAARVPGARVHFDIDHASGGTRATGVTLKRGTRSARGQRRFGDLTGAPTEAAKVQPGSGDGLDPELFRSPIRAAAYWAEQLAIGDLDEVMVLYGPTAALHAGGQVLVGHDAIRRHWQASPLLGGPAPAEVRGDDDDRIVLRWAPQQVGRERAETRLHIARGEIVEQWQGAIRGAERTGDATELPLELSVDGDVSDRHRALVLERIGKVLSKVDDPVLHARVRLVDASGTGRDRPAIAKVQLDLDGEPIRAAVTAVDLDVAIDQLEERLRHQIERLASHREALTQRGTGTAVGWRHGDQPAERPDHFPRPVEERQVVRHKTFTTVEATLDEALFDMEALDYDFFLFTDLASGQEVCVARQDDGRIRLQVQDGDVEATLAGTAAADRVDPSTEPAPELDLQAAREMLDVGPDPWVFSTDPETGRGRLLYRRYDGHYGLITPR